MEITKEKNLVKFQLAKTRRTYVLDINTGSFYNEKTSNGLSAFPAYFKKELTESMRTNKEKPAVTSLLYTLVKYGGYNLEMAHRISSGVSAEQLQYFAEVFMTIDKIESAGISEIKHIKDLALYREDVESLQFINRHFSQFIKWWKNDYPEELKRDDYTSVRMMLRFPWEYQKMKLVEQYPSVKFIYNSSQYGPNLISGLISMITEKQWTEKEIKYALYYLQKGLYGEYMAYNCRINTMYDRIDNYFNMRNAMGLNYEKDLFIKTFMETSKIYELKKQEYENKQLANIQSDNLFFENEDFTTIIPKSVDAFIQEGQSQHNCVGGYVSRVTGKERNVVFIRRKNNPEKSFVTCDIFPATNSINQFLLSCNTTVNSSILDKEEREKLLNFKEEYQKYLWNLKRGEENV